MTQSELAARLGVTTGYISKLEQGLYIPSDQLILSICRVCHVTREWLEKGVGEKYDRIEGTMDPIIGNICRVIGERCGPLSLFTYALLTGIDINDPGSKNEQTKLFTTVDADEIIGAVVEILREGDKAKIDAMRALVFSMSPSKREDVKDPDRVREYRAKEVRSRIEYAQQLERAGELLGAIKEYHNLYFLASRRWFVPPDDEVLGTIKDEYRLSIKRNRKYNRVFDSVCSAVGQKPGIREAELKKQMREIFGPFAPEELHRLLQSAVDLGYVERIAKGRKIELFPIDKASEQ